MRLSHVLFAIALLLASPLGAQEIVVTPLDDLLQDLTAPPPPTRTYSWTDD
ncbi:hypothetical protein N9876_00215 [bacterium]|nr:hypothetical protein [bacterium]